MTEKRDYRDTVFLPKTDFPMKAGLPQKEPGILARWQSDAVYQQLRKARAGREKFILHDGPPYANGDIHIGHALNKVLKDAVVRTQSLLGKDAPYVPGWDCHGLPIEWKVEEQYRKKKLNKDEVPPREFRAECREYAQKWVDVQREQFKRLGITGEWDDPYLTMAPEAEAGIVAELLKFAETGQLYRGAKPVMWSPVEKTALAEAEVEYEDITSTQIDVAFEIVESPIEELVGAYAVIWTTTPWTIPVNQALAYGPDVGYLLVTIDNRKYLVADELLDSFLGRLGNPTPSRVLGWENEGRDFPGGRVLGGFWQGEDLQGTFVRHPMHHLGGFYAEPRPMLPGDFVTTDSGTGIVHLAPDHGEDDFDLCKAHGIGPKFVVDAGGLYKDDWPWLGGEDERRRAVINPKFNAPDGPICEDLKAAGALLSAADYHHSYPHSWRSKAKVIYRCTPQWFVPMDKRAIDDPDNRNEQRWENEGGAPEPLETLRQIAMEEIAKTRFVPEKGRNRIGSMVEGRPDWVLSRQRAWGVPITLFVDRKSGEYLVDPAVNARIIAAIRAEGVDGWDPEKAGELLGPDYNPDDYEMVKDILDVWFDSGSTHAFVLESGRWPDLASPADLYLEGSDQHRGWFQSSLLESCATRGRAPYKAVLTHGFTMAADGRKMSKSIGNTVDPLKVMEEYGADIIRLWALSVDFTEDHRIGPEILKGVADQYRKLRNTFRYMLGALEGFDEAERVAPEDMPELERYVLALLAQLDAKLRRAVEDFDFNSYTRALSDFCNEDLSAFYFDIRKDSLYCDGTDDPKRMACRTVLDMLFHALVRYAAPVLVFTSEEVWGTRFPEAGSVHLLEWPVLPASVTPAQAGVHLADSADGEMDSGLRRNDGLIEKWAGMRIIRASVNAAIEPLRRSKEIRSPLEADVILRLSVDDEFGWDGMNLFVRSSDNSPIFISLPELVEVCMVASINVVEGSGDIRVSSTSSAKCGRCWRLLPEVTEDGDLCGRCETVVAQMDAAP